MMRPLLTQATLALALLAGPAGAQLPPGVEKPQPTVPEVFTLQGEFVRLAYGEEGFVTLGYRTANASQGEDWMLLEVGLTVRKGAKDQTLKREAFSIKTPDGTVVPLATQKEYAEAFYLPALTQRAKTVRDSLNYFPMEANRPVAFRFFADLRAGGNPLAFDQFDVNYSTACLGRLFFKVPGGIKTGQYWLVVQFATSRVEVPFRILTKDEEKLLRKNWEEIKAAHEKALKGE